MEPWEAAEPTRIPPQVRVYAPKWGPNELFLTSTYVDYLIVASVHLRH